LENQNTTKKETITNRLTTSGASVLSITPMKEGFFDKEGNEIKINFKICKFVVYDGPISHLLRNLLFSK
jgi:hypothetical protein